MADRQWSSIERHFDALHELSPEARAAELAAIGDEEIRREVASLLDPRDWTSRNDAGLFHDKIAYSLRDAELLDASNPGEQSVFALSWARLEAARWLDRAIAEAEEAYRKMAVPASAWGLARALDFAAAAVPDSAKARRQRIPDVWSDQNRRFPGLPYIEQKVREAESWIR